MKKTIELGKIDYNRSGRKNCMITVELELRDTDKGPEFSACADIWNPRMTDIYCGGQCFDTIKEFLDTTYDADCVMREFPNYGLFMEIYELWKRNHLNTMHAGTEAQEIAIDTFEALGNRYTYGAVCEYLRSVNLYEDNGYKYGSGWLYREISAEDLEKIKKLIEG